jgi:hypothetical protein
VTRRGGTSSVISSAAVATISAANPQLRLASSPGQRRVAAADGGGRSVKTEIGDRCLGSRTPRSSSPSSALGGPRLESSARPSRCRAGSWRGVGLSSSEMPSNFAWDAESPDLSRHELHRFEAKRHEPSSTLHSQLCTRQQRHVPTIAKYLRMVD